MGVFECNRILDRFKEQDLKFGSFGNLGLKYTLLMTVQYRRMMQQFSIKTYIDALRQHAASKCQFSSS